MDFADKPFSFYWPYIRVPTLILVLWGLAAFVLSLISLDLYYSIFTSLNGIIVQVAVLSYVGFTIIDKCKKKATPSHSAWGGALTGAMAGFAGAIFGILTIYLVPGILDVAIQQAVAQGADAGMVQAMAKIGTWVSLITGPLFGGLIGALVAWISGLISRKACM